VVQGARGYVRTRRPIYAHNSLPLCLDAVLEDGGAVFGDGDFELGGPGGRLGVVKGVGEENIALLNIVALADALKVKPAKLLETIH
uniref:hypothetical protein n=1 Tax=Vibrio paracholerae TaxID=650003 RepID=UPI002094B282